MKSSTKIILISIILLLGYFILSPYIFNKKEILYFDFINSIVLTEDGYVSVGSNNNNNNSYEKGKIVFYDLNKKIVNEIICNKGNNSSYNDVLYDKDNIVAVGKYNSIDSKGQISQSKGLISMYNKDGSLLYDNVYEEKNSFAFVNVKNVEDGYIVIGQCLNRNSSEDYGGVIIKYDKNLNLLWKKNIKGNVVFNRLAIYKDNIYIVGKQDDEYGLLVKYNLDGDLIISKKLCKTGTVGFTDLLIKDNYIYIAGSTYLDKTDYQALLVKTDLDGNIIKDVKYNTNNNDKFERIISDDDNLILIGSMSNLNKNNNLYDVDGFISKYSFELEKIGMEEYGNNKADYLSSIVLDHDDNYLVLATSLYNDGNYFSKLITYSNALNILKVI